MIRTFTASDRAALIRLASSLPVGSPERKALLGILTKTAGGSGAANAAYLRQSPLRNKILQAVAKHYGVSVKDIEAELTDPDAEFVFEYIGNDRALAMAVYRDMKANGLV